MWIRDRAIDRFARRVLERLDCILERTEHMATQADIDRLTQQVSTASTSISDAVDGIRQDIQDLKDANPAVDTSALEASVAQLDQQVSGLTSLDAENPAPPVEKF